LLDLNVAHYIKKINPDVLFEYFTVNSSVYCVKVDVVGETFIMTGVQREESGRERGERK